MRVAVTGASGFIGSALVGSLRAGGHTVATVGRGPASNVRWNPEAGRIDAAALAGMDAVVHLAGAPIGKRWTRERKREIAESRRAGTRLIVDTIAAMSPRASVLVSASGVGYYGDRGDEWLDETSAPGTDFLAGVAQEWESAAARARDAGIRVAVLRNGVVLSPAGGALAMMLPPFRLGAGGRLGTGRQWLSWIALDDVVRAVEFVIATPTLDGPLNAVAPHAVTNEVFATTLGRVLGRPALAPMPAVVLRALFGEMADATLLASQRVRPARLERAGFTFAHPALEEALRFELHR